MLFRITASVVLAALGIASPWLVHDWMEWQEHRTSVAAKEPEMAAPVHSFIRRSREGVAIPDAAPEIERGGNAPIETSLPRADSTSASRSFPMANQTVRIIEGLMSRPFSQGGKDIASLFQRSGVPESERSRLAREETAPALDEAMGKLGLRLGDPIFLRIFKESAEIEVWACTDQGRDFRLFRIYRFEDGGNPGPKEKPGDGCTPEGFYYVSASRLLPDRAAGLALDLGFPNASDKYRGASEAECLITSGGRRDGSFLLEAGKMDEIYTLAHAAIAGGQKFFRVHVFPFRMTDKRMDAEWKAQGKWIDYWVNLKEGYDFFENAHFPPDVGIQGERYAFSIR